MEKNVIKALMTAKKEKTILKGIVKLAQRDAEGNASLIVDYQSVRFVIPQSEVDMEVQYKTLVSFIGTEVIFVILDVNVADDCCKASRARAQAILRPEIVKRLEDGEVITGKVINILPHGAYLEMNGLTGLLKNGDFADDSTNISDIKKVGDTIDVMLKNKSSNGTYIFEAAKKYVSPSAITKDQLEKGQIILGTVRTKQPWGIFVNVAPGVDALIDAEDYDIEENQKVTVKIKQIRMDEDKLKVRGKIISVL